MLWLNEEITTFAHNLVQHLLWTTTSILTWTTLNVGHIFQATVICVCVCVCCDVHLYGSHFNILTYPFEYQICVSADAQTMLQY